jgi:hypothetical protein
MQWATIIATALGAVVGVLSSAASDRLHWRRDVSERDRESLRTAYAEFLDAVTQAGNAISHAAHNHREPLDVRARAARSAPTDIGVYEKQFRVELSAPPDVLPLAGDVVGALLALRDLVARDVRPDTDAYDDGWMQLHTTRAALLNAMRKGLRRT